MSAKATDISSLDWERKDWHEWARLLLETHDRSAVADTVADIGQQVNDLRRGMAAEAIIINAQVFSMNPKAIGKKRAEILRCQVQRMLRCSLAKESPRGLVSYGKSWRERVTMELARFESNQ